MKTSNQPGDTLVLVIYLVLWFSPHVPPNYALIIIFPGHTVTGWVFWDTDRDRDYHAGNLLGSALGINIFGKEEVEAECVRGRVEPSLIPLGELWS